jgi:hypothetical protein
MPFLGSRSRVQAAGRVGNHDRATLTCFVNRVQKVDAAQRVDELLVLYTNIRLRHQRNKVPSYLQRGYNGGVLGGCSKLLSSRNMDNENKRLSKVDHHLGPAQFINSGFFMITVSQRSWQLTSLS